MPADVPVLSRPGRDRLTVWRSVAGLAGPLIVAESVGFLVQLGIVAVMGSMGGEALYLRSLYQPIGLALLAVGMGFGVSCQVSAAISKGAGRPGEVLSIAASFARVWFVSGAVTCLLLAVAAPYLAELADVPADLAGSFVAFLRWTSAAGLLLIAPALAAGCLRGCGYVRQSMVVTVCAAVVELGCVAGLGLGTRIGVAAIPLAEAVCGVTGFALGLVMLRRTGLWHPSLVGVWQPVVLRRLRTIGAPVAASFLVIAAYNAAVILLLGRYGEPVVAGYSVATTVQNLVLLPATMIGAAIAVMVNQQRGAGDHERIPLSVRGGLELSALVYLLVALLVWTVAGPVARLLADGPATAAAVAGYLGTVGLTYAVQGPVLASLTVMEHTGGGPQAILLNIVYFALIVAISGTLAGRLGGADGFYDIVAACNLIGIVVPLFALRHARLRIRV